MESFYNTLLQIISGILVFIILFYLFHLLNEKLKLNWIAALLIIILPYLLIGFLTYNVKKERIGAVCCDDSKSESTGSGACSNQGGVREWVVQYHYEEYKKPYNTLHKFFYFWYAINKDHTELDYESDCDEDLPIEPPGPGY